jgi:hypothetical protein
MLRCQKSWAKTSVPDSKHFGTEPEFNIRVLRIRILTCFQNVWRALVLKIFNMYKTMYFMFKSKQVNVLMIFSVKLRYRKYRYLNIEKNVLVVLKTEGSGRNHIGSRSEGPKNVSDPSDAEHWRKPTLFSCNRLWLIEWSWSTVPYSTTNISFQFKIFLRDRRAY